MSAELVSASGNNAGVQGTTLGGSKPLHRFIKGQPKIVGIIMLILGSSFFIISVALIPTYAHHIWTVIPPGFLQGTLFIICGILYIIAEHKPTKKTVTISLALTIVTLLGTCWAILHITPSIIHSHYRYHHRHYDIFEDNVTETDELWSFYYEAMETCLEAIYLFYNIVGAIIFITMSVLAGTALRSTRSQAIIVMTTTAAETPVE